MPQPWDRRAASVAPAAPGASPQARCAARPRVSMGQLETRWRRGMEASGACGGPWGGAWAGWAAKEDAVPKIAQRTGRQGRWWAPRHTRGSRASVTRATADIADAKETPERNGDPGRDMHSGCCSHHPRPVLDRRRRTGVAHGSGGLGRTEAQHVRDARTRVSDLPPSPGGDYCWL
jgi:hypothetical protein